MRQSLNLPFNFLLPSIPVTDINSKFISIRFYLKYINSLHRANSPAGIAFNTKSGINAVLFMWGKRNGIHRAFLDTKGTSDAIIVYRIGNHCGTFSCGTNSVDMCFIFIAEIFQCTVNRIGRCFSQSAEASLYLSIQPAFSSSSISPCFPFPQL
jgi:hypothetical protein